MSVKRKKKYNSSRLIQQDADKLFSSMVVYSGTGLIETQISVDTRFKRECLSSPLKLSSSYYNQLLANCKSRLMTYTNWIVATICIVDNDKAIKTKESVKDFKSMMADSAELTDLVHQEKIALGKNVNPDYLLGIYTIFIPGSLNETRVDLDLLIDQLLVILDNDGLLNSSKVLSNFLERLPDSYVADLKSAGLSTSLGKAIKATLVGFDTID